MTVKLATMDVSAWENCRLGRWKHSPWYINLNLEGNKIGETGCKGLSGRDWPSLEQVNLGNNLLTKAGISWEKGSGLLLQSKMEGGHGEFF